MAFLKEILLLLVIILLGVKSSESHVLGLGSRVRDGVRTGEQKGSKLTKYIKTPNSVIEQGGDRSKRAAFMVEGTVWCGVGDTASSYSDLGYHRETDTCCRDHDHCPAMITGFSWKYDVFNYMPYTINLCGCDERFRDCLLAANTSVSQKVGAFFFDTLRPMCFNLSEPTERCLSWGWFGNCYEYGMRRTATMGSSGHFLPD
ncbi:phospholipase A2 isozymes PA3A/PA3B/PA5-like [Asterias rubens]|uniref:phospholipase A2 isozymes PA3A/PA3B/PA5-like n=1 Tax=Asterias rubens TaxID=7604 RepID=UPI001455C0ED|nr:phospholipase A2 isozymes PA3A/PA3B/PA5-like [Asterias rubens]